MARRQGTTLVVLGWRVVTWLGQRSLSDQRDKAWGADHHTGFSKSQGVSRGSHFGLRGGQTCAGDRLNLCGGVVGSARR
eukprot:scaffold299106_cov17-Tisochrysis_lutea.AAC.3